VLPVVFLARVTVVVVFSALLLIVMRRVFLLLLSRCFMMVMFLLLIFVVIVAATAARIAMFVMMHVRRLGLLSWRCWRRRNRYRSKTADLL
jgi:O-antigen ligase